MSVKVLGILNVTPDSFSDGGLWQNLDRALERASRMVEEGATAIDVGGESTRPGSREISVQEELDRVLPCLEAIGKKIGVPLSIDTRRVAVAREAATLGATIINDTSALRDDPDLMRFVIEEELNVVLMHRQGTPETMQDNPQYSNVIAEVRDFFQGRIDDFVAAGGRKEQLIIDPGIGFGKRLEDNYLLAAELASFRSFGIPVMLGASRKACTGALDGAPPDDRLPGSLAFVAMAQRAAVEWVRVHDVGETVRFLNVLEAINYQSKNMNPDREVQA